MPDLWAAVFHSNSRRPVMANFFPLRDLNGRQIPGMPSVIELPKGLAPSDYKDGVYLVGEILIPAADMDRLNPFERRSLLKHPHMLLYGHRGREMQVMDSHVLTRVAVGLGACLLLAHPLLGLF